MRHFSIARCFHSNGEGKEEAASPPQKEANPASLRSAAPSKGRGSRGYSLLPHSLLPMEGGAPKGRRLDGGSRMKKIEGRSSQVRCLREQRYPHIVRANTCMCGKTIPPTKPSPRGEGGERSEPDRVLATRKISGKIVSSRQFTRAPERRYAVPLPQGGKATDTRMSLFSHRQSEYRIRV